MSIYFKMQTNKDTQTLILETLKQKSSAKQLVLDNTFSAFKTLKDVIKYQTQNTRKSIKDITPKITVGHKESGTLQIEMLIATDLLVFTMHTSVFVFDKSHPVWKTQLLTKDPDMGYFGVINIYNFLADSIKYNRFEDLGYLIGRIFVNKNNHFIVEGKRQLGILYNNIGENIIDKKSLSKILQSAILYALDFDLLVPPYEQSAIISVEQLKTKNDYVNVKIGKRLGFKFYNENEDNFLL